MRDRHLEPKVSVVIPYLGDGSDLAVCLKALSEQTYPVSSTEIIVVDNGTDENVKRLAGSIPNVVYVAEKIRSAHACRNTGILAATGTILAFTDGDCVPDENWLENGVRRMCLDRNCGLLGGKIEIFYVDPEAPTACELFEAVTAFKQDEYISKWHFAATGNAFTRQAIIDKVGLLKGDLKSGADLEWGQRIYQAGFNQIYGEDVVVKHPARRSLSKMLAKHRRVIGGLSDIKAQKEYPFKSFLVDLKDDWPGLADMANILKDVKLKGFWSKAKVLMVLTCVKWARIFERIRLYYGGRSIWG